MSTMGEVDARAISSAHLQSVDVDTEDGIRWAIAETMGTGTVHAGFCAGAIAASLLPSLKDLEEFSFRLNRTPEKVAVSEAF
ncbi:MAG: hypothetical protein SFY95_02720 [Planctomycetota bacterium]|nr:hypothetical protein [Planctomycetota bacterium]